MGWHLGRRLNDVVPFVLDLVRAASMKHFGSKSLLIEPLYGITF